jgi:hypothetical protein
MAKLCCIYEGLPEDYFIPAVYKELDVEAAAPRDWRK